MHLGRINNNMGGMQASVGTCYRTVLMYILTYTYHSYSYALLHCTVINSYRLFYHLFPCLWLLFVITCDHDVTQCLTC